MADKLPGKRSYIKAMTEQQQRGASTILPFMAKAIEFAENDKLKRSGVRSVAVATPEEGAQVRDNSIVNNLSRWLQDRQGTLPKWDRPATATPRDKYVDYMQKRWAPIGAENDPEGLNKNWAPNVRESLRQQLGDEEYRRWQLYNLVRLRALGNRGVA